MPARTSLGSASSLPRADLMLIPRSRRHSRIPRSTRCVVVPASLAFRERKVPREAGEYRAATASLSGFECGQGFTVQWSIEVVGDFDFSFQQPEVLLANWRRYRREPRNGLSCFSDDDFRARGHFFHQPRQMSFRLVDVYAGHDI